MKIAANVAAQGMNISYTGSECVKNSMFQCWKDVQINIIIDSQLLFSRSVTFDLLGKN